MKKLFIVLVAICTIGISASHAQEMKKGMSLFNVGLGFVPGWGLNVSYDYGIVDKWGPGIFTVGGFVGFSNWGESVYTEDYRATEFVFAPRATYRYAINSSFEVYATAMFGAYFINDSFKEYDNNRSGIYFGSTAGCRYSFAKNLSVFAELGYNVTCLNGGLSLSF